jgi:predicted nucleotidyltransferase
MKTKKLPGFIKHPWLVAFFQSKVGRITSNWVLQGMLYMNPVETFYKLALDVALTGIWWAVAFRSWDPQSWLLALILAHTTNWIINGQPIAMRRHLDWGRNDARHFIAYVEQLERRVQGRSYLAAAASFGSLSRGKYSDKSDIDIRVVMHKGLMNRLRAANFCFWERLRAAIAHFPLDLYAFELDEMRRKMKSDEVPVIFYDPDGVLGETYRETVAFPVFQRNFRASVLGEAAL